MYMHSSWCKPLLASSAECFSHLNESPHFAYTWKVVFRKKAAAITCISTSFAQTHPDSALHPRLLHVLFHTLIRGYKGGKHRVLRFIDHVSSYNKTQFLIKLLIYCYSKWCRSGEKTVSISCNSRCCCRMMWHIDHYRLLHMWMISNNKCQS